MKLVNFKPSLDMVKEINNISNNCVQYWWYQRLTAILMVPLLMWLICFIKAMIGKSVAEIVEITRYPWNIVPVILLFVLAFYHSVLGIRVIIEDYVSNPIYRYILIILVQVFTIITVVCGIVATIVLI